MDAPAHVLQSMGVCGRFSLADPRGAAESLFGDAEGPLPPASGNVSPGDPVLAAGRSREGAVRPAVLRWGFPSPRPDRKGLLVNARSEAAAATPSFRGSFRRRRCVVAADGFYEWARAPGGRPDPWLFSRADGGPLALGGLWAPLPQGGGGAGACCVILATEAGEDVRGVHPRMPVIVPAAALGEWLSEGASRPGLRALMAPAPGGTLRASRARPPSRRP